MKDFQKAFHILSQGKDFKMHCCEEEWRNTEVLPFVLLFTHANPPMGKKNRVLIATFLENRELVKAMIF